MERAKLIVKNFGPLKDIEIEIREMVTFIGAQASGKSTLAKLISILEDEEFRNDYSLKFEDELKKYNIISYLNKDSYIDYKSTKYSMGSFNFKYSDSKYKKGGIQNMISSIKNLHFSFKKMDSQLNKAKKNKDNENAALIFLDELYEQKNLTLKEAKELLLILLNLHFKHNKKNLVTLFNGNEDLKKIEIFLQKKEKDIFTNDELDFILEKENTLENIIKLLEKLINTFPNIYLYDSIYIPAERNLLQIIAGNILGLINNGVQIPKHLLNIGQEYEKAIQTITELPLNIIDKKIHYKREGQKSYIYHSNEEKVDLLESASGLQSVIPILLLVEYSKSLKEKYNFNFVVEEPELNLYPKAQYELIKYLVKNCLFDRKNLIITTHSPFILASINNLLLAYDKGQKHDKEVNKIIKKESWLNPKNFIAYELKNGKAKLIMDDKLGQIADNMIDSVSDTFADEFDKLLDL